jgi:hypothetical protein
MRRSLLVLTLIPTLGCVWLSSHDQDWAFMERVGGIAVRGGRVPGGSVRLSVDCDVSGVRTITLGGHPKPAIDGRLKTGH